jgi:uncharacterized protein YegJ (DUF2314 family)
MKRRAHALVLLCLAGCASCSRPSARAVRPGPLLSEAIEFEFAVFFLPAPRIDPLARLDAVVAREFPAFRKMAARSAARQGMSVSAHLVDDVRRSYAPPNAESLSTSGRGLSTEQGAALQASRSALVLDFRLSREHGWEGLRSACELASRLARDTGGLLWDAETREVFSPDEWDSRRLATWTEKVPDVSRQVTIHAYRKSDLVRGITLGMVKLGLPDLVVEGFPWSAAESVENLIDSLAQALAEGAQAGSAGEVTLRLKALRNTAARERQVRGLKPKAKGEARLRLLLGRREAGDPENRLIEIGFDRYPGPDGTARQNALLSELFGAPDSILTPARHDDQELLAASRHAREQLPSLRQAFAKGMAPGEYILLKAPFATPDGGTEWMWVEVVSWKGGAIEGVLQDDPSYAPGLHAGQMVAVAEERVFDYLHRSPDGTQQGNETGRVLEREARGKH